MNEVTDIMLNSLDSVYSEYDDSEYVDCSSGCGCGHTCTFNCDDTCWDESAMGF